MKCAHLALALVILLNPLLRAAQNPDAAVRMERKLQHVESNGRLPHPDQTPTKFTELEIDAYLASGDVQLPPGVQSARFEEQPGIVTATTRVDFDKLKAGASSSNPLLSIFTGVHEVVTVAHTHGSGGQGFVQVDSVALDGVQIPRFVLQIFVDKYLKAKYPQAGLDSRFALPNKIDTATVGSQSVTVAQK